MEDKNLPNWQKQERTQISQKRLLMGGRVSKRQGYFLSRKKRRASSRRTARVFRTGEVKAVQMGDGEAELPIGLRDGLVALVAEGLCQKGTLGFRRRLWDVPYGKRSFTDLGVGSSNKRERFKLREKTIRKREGAKKKGTIGIQKD